MSTLAEAARIAFAAAFLVDHRRLPALGAQVTEAQQALGTTFLLLPFMPSVTWRMMLDLGLVSLA